MSLYNVLISFAARTKEFEVPVQRMEKHLERFSKRVDSVSRFAKGAFATIGVGLSVREIVRFSQAMVEASDKVGLLSKRLETFSGTTRSFAMAYDAAQRLGTSVETVADGMARLLIVGKGVGITAKSAQQLAETFLQLGRIGGASADEAARGFTQLTQGMGRGVLQGQDLKAVMTSVPLVAKAIADELGVGIGQLSKMGEQGRITTDVIVRGLQNVGDEARKQFGELPDTLEQQKSRLSNAWTGILAALDNKLRQSEVWQFAMFKMARAFENAQTYLSESPADIIDVQIADAAAKIDKLRAGLQNLTEGGRLWQSQQARLDELHKYISGLYQQRAALESMGDAEMAAADASAAAEAKRTAALEAQRKALEALVNWKLDGTAQRVEDTPYQKLLKGWEESTRTTAQKMAHEWEEFRLKLDGLFAAGVIGVEEYNKRVGDYLDRTLGEYEVQSKRIKETTKSTFRDMSVFAEQAARNMQTYLADFLFDPFDKGIKGMLKGFIDVLRRMIAEAAAAKIFDALGFGSKGGGLFGKILGGLFGAGASGGSSTSAAGARAMGGPVSAGSLYQVNETGKEYFRPNMSGEVIPLGKMDRAAGSVSVTFAPVYSIDARGASVELMQRLPAMLREVNRASVNEAEARIVERLRRGVYGFA